jgi:uncharacterized small protein (DUF1192 family)
MTEEVKPIVDEQDPEGDTDYKALYEAAKAEAHKWERRSKRNFEKANKYDELLAGGDSIEERIAALEADKQRLEDEKNRATLVKSVAKATGVPESIVSNLSATDEEALTAQAKSIADNYKTPGGAPSAPESGKFAHGDDKHVDEKRAFVRDLMKQTNL